MAIPGKYIWSNFITQGPANEFIPQPDSAIYQLS